MIDPKQGPIARLPDTVRPGTHPSRTEWSRIWWWQTDQRPRPDEGEAVDEPADDRSQPIDDPRPVRGPQPPIDEPGDLSEVPDELVTTRLATTRRPTEPGQR